MFSVALDKSHVYSLCISASVTLARKRINATYGALSRFRAKATTSMNVPKNQYCSHQRRLRRKRGSGGGLRNSSREGSVVGTQERRICNHFVPDDRSQKRQVAHYLAFVPRQQKHLYIGIYVACYSIFHLNELILY